MLRARRAAVADQWGLERGAVLVPSGLSVPIHGTDQSHEYHTHPEHYYLSGLVHPGSVLTFDPGEGWTLFANQASLEQQVWTNASEPLEEQAARSGIDNVLNREALRAWLERRRSEPLAVIGNDDLVHHPDGYGIENWSALELDIDEELSVRCSDTVSAARRAKDPSEIEFMRAAATASIAGHMSALRHAAAGMTERTVQVELEAEFFRHGALRTAYGSIVGTGPDGSVLHFSPGSRELRSGDIVLIDAAAEIAGYASDITRTFPVDANFTPMQASIYDLVLATQTRAIQAVRPGVEYRDLHMAAALNIAGGLGDLGILRGNPADLVEQDAHALFFPHGLGHMLGLATHDAGGCLAGRERSERFGLKYLRADLPLQPGYIVTIEPGIYFIRALLTDPERRAHYRDAVNWEMVDTMLDFGGIRIEDDILVTPTGVEVLSGALPRERNDIEDLRREALAL